MSLDGELSRNQLTIFEFGFHIPGFRAVGIHTAIIGEEVASYCDIEQEVELKKKENHKFSKIS